MQFLPVSIAFVILKTLRLSQAFAPSFLRQDRLTESSQLWGTEPGKKFLDRRRFVDVASITIAAAGWTLVAPPSIAESSGNDEDLTSKLFNADGSIKDAANIETEARFRTVALSWDASDQLSIAVDGVNTSGTSTGTAIQLSYALPEKWGSSGNDLYVDRSEGANIKACNHIIIYQAPGKADLKRLEKASTTGIAKALDVTADLADIKQADLIGGRVRNGQNGQKFFEFDMAVAPEKCESSKEDLGLGFCPYESIYLLSSTILNDRLYVFALQCDKSEWKRANSDLRAVRSSFTVQDV